MSNKDYEFKCNYCAEAIYYSDKEADVSFYRTHGGQSVHIYMWSLYEGQKTSLTWERIEDILTKYFYDYLGSGCSHTIIIKDDEPNYQEISRFVEKMNGDGNNFIIEKE